MARTAITKFRNNHPLDESLMVAYLLLTAAGLIMIYSASSILAESRFGSNWFFFRQQLIWAAISVAAIFVVSKLDLKQLAVYSVPALLVTIILLAVVFLMPARNGSHRWLMLGPFTVQPSELFKGLTILYLAFSLSNPKRDLRSIKQLLFPYLPLLGLGMGLVLLEPDLGTTIVLLITIIGIFFLAGARIRHLLIAALPAVGMASILVFALGYKRTRIMDFINSVMDPLQGSYQAKQAALTLGAGGLFGTGLGDGRQKLFFLPYPHTDFILASIGEELGFIGIIIIMGLLFFLLWRGCQIAARQPDKFGYLLAMGMTWSLFTNIAINISVVTSMLPVTGLALPFLSYGGSSLVISSLAVGVLINLSKRVKWR